MLVFLLGVGIFIIAIFTWFSFVFLSLINKRNKTKKSFEQIDLLFKKRYDVISDILAIVQPIMIGEHNLAEKVNNIKTSAIVLNNEFYNIDRKIALNEELYKSVDTLISQIESYPTLNSNESLNNLIQVYNSQKNDLINYQKRYNIAATELRYAVDCFPSSFVARLNNIKYSDIMNIQC